MCCASSFKDYDLVRLKEIESQADSGSSPYPHSWSFESVSWEHYKEKRFILAHGFWSKTEGPNMTVVFLLTEPGGGSEYRGKR